MNGVKQVDIEQDYYQTMNRKTFANIGLPQWGLMCFYDCLVLNRSTVHRLNFSAKNPPERQAPNRYAAPYDDSQRIKND